MLTLVLSPTFYYSQEDEAEQGSETCPRLRSPNGFAEMSWRLDFSNFPFQCSLPARNVTGVLNLEALTQQGI